MKKVIAGLLATCTILSLFAFTQTAATEKSIISGTAYLVCDMTTPEKK